MGGEAAALSVILIELKARQNLVHSPGGYLRGMIRKAEAGALDLQKSVFGAMEIG